MRADEVLVQAHLSVLRSLRDRLEEKGYRYSEDVAGVSKGSLVYARWFVEHALERAPLLPLDKLARWTGFLQGVLANAGFLDVDMERDRTRGIFESAYKELGMKPVEKQGGAV